MPRVRRRPPLPRSAARGAIIGADRRCRPAALPGRRCAAMRAGMITIGFIRYAGRYGRGTPPGASALLWLRVGRVACQRRRRKRGAESQGRSRDPGSLRIFEDKHGRTDLQQDHRRGVGNRAFPGRSDGRSPPGVQEGAAETSRVYAIAVAADVAGPDAGAAAADTPPDWGTVLKTADVSAGEAKTAGVQGLPHLRRRRNQPHRSRPVGRGGPQAGQLTPASPIRRAWTAFAAKQPVWDYEHIYEFLKGPQRLYRRHQDDLRAGLKDPQDRINVIAYLHTLGSTLPDARRRTRKRPPRRAVREPTPKPGTAASAGRRRRLARRPPRPPERRPPSQPSTPAAGTVGGTPGTTNQLMVPVKDRPRLLFAIASAAHGGLRPRPRRW